jgi:type IV pilus assembly protein PilM
MLEQTLAVGVQESVIAYESHPNDDGSLTIMSYLTRETALEEHLAYFKNLSINPEWIIPKAACLAAFVSHFALQEWQFVVDIGSEETTAVLVYNGQVIESRSLVGGCSVFAHLQESSSENDGPLTLFLQHLTEALLAYKERYGVEDGGGLTVTGSVLAYPLSDKVISEFVQIPLSPLHDTSDGTSLLSHAAAVGATFLSCPHGSASATPNFRSGRFSFPNPLLHWKRPLTALAVSCLAIAAVIVWYGMAESQRIVENMRQEWKNITLAAHTTPENVNVRTESAPGPILPPHEASSEQLLAQGNWLLSSIERQTSYPLHPDIPRVTDVIVWLSTQISDIAQANSASDTKFEIQGLSYQLVKHPTKNRPKERYQVRVEIEFVTPSVALARAFHNRLVSHNQYIDPASEVKWTPSNGKYRASFFLKDKTHYPPQEL